MSTSEPFSCSTRVLSSAINKEGDVRLLQGTSNRYSTRQQCTFVLIAERLVLAHQFIALRLHRSGYLVEPQNQNWRLGGRRQDPGASRSFEAEDTRRDHKACVEAKRGAVAVHPSDGAKTRIPKVPLGGVCPSFM
jgi:hypothetical protein